MIITIKSKELRKVYKTNEDRKRVACEMIELILTNDIEKGTQVIEKKTV